MLVPRWCWPCYWSLLAGGSHAAGSASPPGWTHNLAQTEEIVVCSGLPCRGVTPLACDRGLLNCHKPTGLGSAYSTDAFRCAFTHANGALKPRGFCRYVSSVVSSAVSPYSVFSRHMTWSRNHTKSLAPSRDPTQTKTVETIPAPSYLSNLHRRLAA